MAYRRYARRAARREGLDPRVFERQIQQESGFNPSARSPAGATGIAQIMPATARGWGVDPTNPKQSLDAAARNMASYVRKYGSYENALRAYNAGPGAIQASKGYAETNNYVRTILGGKEPGKLGRARRGGGTTTRTVTHTRPGIDNRQARAQLIQSFLQDKGSDPVSFALGIRELKDVPGRTTSRSQRVRGGGRGDVGDRGEDPITGSEIKELFWQGPGGVNLKNGQQVPQGFVSGHQDHVHVAAGPRTVVALGNVAKRRFGLHVGEQSHFGGRPTAGHAPNSYHYRDQAIDVSGDAEAMRRFAHYVKRYSRNR